MKEIRFRAWHKKDKIMLHHLKVSESLNDTFKSDNLVFMQYTGLKDKNGVEIYEGDILQSPDFFPSEVFYREGYAAFFAHDCNLREFFDLSAADGIGNKFVEVIGNIYENTELVK